MIAPKNTKDLDLLGGNLTQEHVDEIITEDGEPR
jgi:hypothetical protein